MKSNKFLFVLMIAFLFGRSAFSQDYFSNEFLYSIVDTLNWRKECRLPEKGFEIQIKKPVFSVTDFELNNCKVVLIKFEVAKKGIGIGSGFFRVFVIIIRKNDKPIQIYDSGFFMPECGQPSIVIGPMEFFRIKGQSIFMMDVIEEKFGCCGQSTTQKITAYFYNYSQGFSLAYKLEKSYLDLKDDECGSNKPDEKVYRLTRIFPNGVFPDSLGDNFNYVSVRENDLVVGKKTLKPKSYYLSLENGVLVKGGDGN